MIKTMIKNERPRERLLYQGASSLSINELIAIIIGCGTRKMSAIDVANNILKSSGSISGLIQMSVKELMRIDGVGLAKATSIKASLELGLRVKNEAIEQVTLNNAKVIYDMFYHELIFLTNEVFIGLYIDVKCHLISRRTLFSGGLHQTNVFVREIFKWAVKDSAYGIILIHNHPSGDPTPSKSDEEFTKRIVDLGKELDILICDHIVFAKKGYYSFLEKHRFFP